MAITYNPKIIRSMRRTISLQVLPDTTLVVKAPIFATDRVIEKFIHDNLEWIEKKLSVVKKHTHLKQKLYVNGDKFFYLGNEYELKLTDISSITIKDKIIQFPHPIQFRIKKELTNWYIKQAKKVITQQVDYYSTQMKVNYLDLSFSDTKSQWGRCTHDNRLQFNWRIVMAPLLVINYVVVHELAHIQIKDHSRAFWSKVRLYNPSYRQQIKWLKEHGNSLVV